MTAPADTPPAAGIKSISIRNFRGIESLDLSFTNPQGELNGVTVLGGPNGCGKTSVLEACLVGIRQYPLIRAARGRDARRGMIRSAGQTFEVEVNYLCPRDRFGVVEPQSGRSRVTSGNLLHPYKKAATLPALYVPSARTTGFAGPVSALTINYPQEAKRFANPMSGKLRLTAAKRKLVNAEFKRLFRREPRENGEHRSATVDREVAGDDLLQTVNQAWCLFYGRQRFSVRPVEGQRDGADSQNDGADVYLEGPEIAPDRPADFLSSGQLELFITIVEAAAAKDAAPVIIIDEPELHLDPSWHRRVLHLFRTLKPGAQVIAATHSPEVFDSVRSWERHFLLPPEDPRAKLWAGREARAEAVGAAA